MPPPRPLTEYPPATLDSLRGTLAALLSYRDMLPTDPHVKLSLFRADVTAAITPPPPRSPAMLAMRTQSTRGRAP